MARELSASLNNAFGIGDASNVTADQSDSAALGSLAAAVEEKYFGPLPRHH